MTADPFASFDEAVAALGAGRVVAIPTDTVYGLAVDPSVPGATAAVFVCKGRPPALELPVLVAGEPDADALAGPDGLPAVAAGLARRFWPGALTIVVRRRPGLDWSLGGDETTIGLRSPDHALARALCRQVGPLATTSANRHGEPALTTAAEVRAVFGDEVVVLDGGRCPGGVASTVVDVTGPSIRCLRQGAIPFDDVVAAVASGPT
ncbi:MAG: L-threonylcarbamoyladenylate synthase [Acidimicrobiales bacterium]